MAQPVNLDAIRLSFRWRPMLSTNTLAFAWCRRGSFSRHYSQISSRSLGTRGLSLRGQSESARTRVSPRWGASSPSNGDSTGKVLDGCPSDAQNADEMAQPSAVPTGPAAVVAGLRSEQFASRGVCSGAIRAAYDPEGVYGEPIQVHTGAAQSRHRLCFPGPVARTSLAHFDLGREESECLLRIDSLLSFSR